MPSEIAASCRPAPFLPSRRRRPAVPAAGAGAAPATGIAYVGWLDTELVGHKFHCATGGQYKYHNQRYYCCEEALAAADACLRRGGRCACAATPTTSTTATRCRCWARTAACWATCPGTWRPGKRGAGLPQPPPFVRAAPPLLPLPWRQPPLPCSAGAGSAVTPGTHALPAPLPRSLAPLMDCGKVTLRGDGFAVGRGARGDSFTLLVHADEAWFKARPPGGRVLGGAAARAARGWLARKCMARPACLSACLQLWLKFTTCAPHLHPAPTPRRQAGGAVGRPAPAPADQGAARGRGWRRLLPLPPGLTCTAAHTGSCARPPPVPLCFTS